MFPSKTGMAPLPSIIFGTVFVLDLLGKVEETGGQLVGIVHLLLGNRMSREDDKAVIFESRKESDPQKPPSRFRGREDSSRGRVQEHCVLSKALPPFLSHFFRPIFLAL